MADPLFEDGLLHDLIGAALRAGADAAEAVAAERSSLSVGVRLGALEEVEREESRDLGLRVFIGRRQAAVSTSDISAETRARLVERATAMARLAPEDPFAGLLDPDALAGPDRPDLDLFDPHAPDADALEARAQAAEAAGRAVAGVTNSEGGSASVGQGRWRLVTSAGFDGLYRSSHHGLSVGVIAGETGAMERGGEGRSQRWMEDLPSPEAIGRTAGERAVRRLGARKIGSRTAPVILENRIAGGLLGALAGAISGPAVTRGVSFLKDRLGEPVLAAGLNLVDDPLMRRGLGSAPFDDEGAPATRRLLVEDGRLVTWLLNAASARQLGLSTTGHASRGLAGPAGVSTHNLYLEPGRQSLEALMAEAGQGLLVTSMFGPSLNANTGDWSAGVSGFWFEGGVAAFPTAEITIAGNLKDFFLRLVPGADLEFRGATNAPSLLIDAVAIAGK